jgi:hypothetical protein
MASNELEGKVSGEQGDICVLQDQDYYQLNL